MSYSTTVGVDLAKNVIQISVVSDRGKQLSNRQHPQQRSEALRNRDAELHGRVVELQNFVENAM